MNVRRGGLGPSNAAAAPRAFLLIAVAVVIGLVLLWKGLDSTPGTVAPAGAPVVVESPIDESTNDLGSGTFVDETRVAGGDTSSDQPATTEVPVPTTTEDLFPEPTFAPNEVKVLVANGSGVSGAAGKVTDMLTPLGWAMESPANASKASTSGIYYKTGYAHNARLIQDHFGEDPSILSQFPTGGLAMPDASLDRVDNADIVIILGSDLAIQGG
ncbi:MAG: LytR C-terminal domain-containing protein [Acidimicrobiales bacterium]|jgi:hypothetical protein|nr:LytR C-terminal domain-containing protein [Acidimicrobiales bacterium]